MTRGRAVAVPMLLGVIAGACAIFAGWWIVLLLVGYALGYHDPWDSLGRRR